MKTDNELGVSFLLNPLLHLGVIFVVLFLAGASNLLIYRGVPSMKAFSALISLISQSSYPVLEDLFTGYVAMRIIGALTFIALAVIVKNIRPGSSPLDALRNLSEGDKRVLGVVVELLLVYVLVALILAMGLRLDVYAVLVCLGLLPLYCLAPSAMTPLAVAVLLATMPFIYSLCCALIHEPRIPLPFASALTSIAALITGLPSILIIAALAGRAGRLEQLAALALSSAYYASLALAPYSAAFMFVQALIAACVAVWGAAATAKRYLQ